MIERPQILLFADDLQQARVFLKNRVHSSEKANGNTIMFV